MRISTLLRLSFSLLSMHPYKVHAHSWMAPEGEAKKENPVEITEVSTNTGKTLFESFCSSCHGQKARGVSKEITGLNSDHLIYQLASRPIPMEIFTGKF